MNCAAMTEFIQAPQVATILGYKSEKAFLKHRSRLERDEHMPKPLPTSKRPLIWRQSAVEAWIDGQGQAHAASQMPTHNERLMKQAQTP